MKAYTIFLRGVMPTGKNKVPMARLRQVLTASGLMDVRTYIQSGNVLARADLIPAQVEELVQHEIKKHFGGDLVVVARTPAQVQGIVADNPFTDADTTKVHFTLLKSKPDEANVKELAGQEFPPDRFLITDEVVYLYCPASYGTTKLNNNFLERRLGVAATTRNHRTMTKLVELGGLYSQ